MSALNQSIDDAIFRSKKYQVQYYTLNTAAQKWRYAAHTDRYLIEFSFIEPMNNLFLRVVVSAAAAGGMTIVVAYTAYTKYAKSPEKK